MKSILMVLLVMFGSTAFGGENCKIHELRLIEEGNYKLSVDSELDVENLDECITVAGKLLNREDVEKISLALSRGSENHQEKKHYIRQVHLRTYKVKASYADVDTNNQEVFIKFKNKVGFFEFLKEL